MQVGIDSEVDNSLLHMVIGTQQLSYYTILNYVLSVPWVMGYTCLPRVNFCLYVSNCVLLKFIKYWLSNFSDNHSRVTHCWAVCSGHLITLIKVWWN